MSNTTTPAAAANPLIERLRNELRQLEADENAGTLTGEAHQRLAVIREQLADVDQADTPPAETK